MVRGPLEARWSGREAGGGVMGPRASAIGQAALARRVSMLPVADASRSRRADVLDGVAERGRRGCAQPFSVALTLEA